MNYKKLSALRLPQPWKTWAVFLLLFGFFWLICWNTNDADFGWHLRTGQYIRAHGIPAHDIYTYTAKTYRWVDHEWGNDVILSFVYGAGGYALTGVMYALLWAGSITIASSRKTRALVMFIAALAITPYAGSRPLAWTVFFLALVIRVLQSPDKRRRWALPAIFLLWANIHAGFIAGLGAVGYYLIRERRKPLFIIFVLSALCTLINPYGLRLYGEIGRTIFDPALHTEIREWLSFDIQMVSYLFVIIWLTGFWSFDRKRWQRWAGLSSFLFLSALSATRNVPLFVVAATQEVDGYLTQAFKEIPSKLDWSRKLVVGIFIAAFAVMLWYTIDIVWSTEIHTGQDNGLDKSIAYLHQHTCEGNLFNSYNLGGYLIWKLPQQPVYIDGRMPTWRPYMQRYLDVVRNPKVNYKQEFRRYDIRCALLTNESSSKLVPLLEKAHWRVVVESPAVILLIAPPSK